MRKLQKASVVVALVGFGFVGAAPAFAQAGAPEAQPAPVQKKVVEKRVVHKGKKVKLDQMNKCRSHDVNISLLNNVGILNGLLGNAIGGEGDPGAQYYEQGSDVSCTNAVGGGGKS